jgi:hypothetical protein
MKMGCVRPCTRRPVTGFKVLWCTCANELARVPHEFRRFSLEFWVPDRQGGAEAVVQKPIWSIHQSSASRGNGPRGVHRSPA